MPSAIFINQGENLDMIFEIPLYSGSSTEPIKKGIKHIFLYNLTIKTGKAVNKYGPLVITIKLFFFVLFSKFIILIKAII